MIRAHDWSGSALGPVEGWPAALRTALGICLASSLPTSIYWGPDWRLVYNDAWAPIPGERHPWSLGRTAKEVWYDIWDFLEPQLQRVMTTGEGIVSYDQLITFERGGAPVETWWNYSLTAIRDESGEIVGIFNQGNETTRLVLAERAQKAETERLRDLFEQAPGAIALLRGPEFVFEFANARYRALVGNRELIGRPAAQALPEVADAGFVELLHRVRRSGETYRADAAPMPLARADGAIETRLLDFVYQPITDAGGAVADIFLVANDVTDRAIAQRKLQQSEERLQLALDASAGVGTWDWDVQANRVTADDRFARLYGVDVQVALDGAPIDQFFAAIHPDDVGRVQGAIERTLATGEAFAEEYRLIDSDRAVRWVAAQGRAHFDAAGRAVRFPGVSFDVTKRRMAEEAARTAAVDLQLATETQAFVFRLAERLRGLDTPAAILGVSTAALGRRLACDRVGFYRLSADEQVRFISCWHNEQLPELAGTIPLDRLDPALVERFRMGETNVIDDYAQMGSGFRQSPLSAGAGLGVPLRRGGQWAAVLFANHAHARHWAADEVSLVEAVAEITWDAVERAQAAVALRESEAKFRAIANSIEQMVWSTTPDGLHDYFNERWYEFTGVPAGSTDGEGWNGVFHPDDQDRAWAMWRHSLATGDHYRIEYRLRHRSGAYRWVLGSAQPVRDDDGRITRWFGTCTDIQEIVEAREVLARSRADLEAAVIERTEQLMSAEAQLRQSQKMEALGQLTGGIAHDFNNMLAVVIGALDLMERRLTQGRTDVTRYVEAARDGATRAAALTQRLLSFSRQTPLDARPIDLNAMVAGMTELLSRTLGENVAIDVNLAPAPWLARVDASQLENAIINLAVNARDAMPRGGRLWITTATCTLSQADADARAIPSGDYVSIAVTDSGSGMSPEVAAKAFDPFFTTKSVGRGTGLGLSQVFGFVRQSGGHVSIDTGPDQGTTVLILLPRDLSDAAPTPARAPVATLPRGSADEIILVVEDEERVRTFSVEALRELGYTVVHAADGPAALRLIDGGQGAALLFTDVVMPEMTGRELADRAVRQLPDLRVLYTSGYTRDVLAPLPGDALLAKPFDVATLATRIRAALDGPAASG
ncbi:PAS domain S-box-containing protein [Sphingomonas guangdongensis]|uniref:histidine kinase n=1 Tax=Sphingomonas guangdongensis TaxID=1141890 RepID=A0A285QDL1_9SPHN|nr:PAS domain-containing protein [Sphingomonas guangdongensis]SOB79916.1 PAS domain S-box-containing protein [Sphingomonas guangdongensis]